MPRRPLDVSLYVITDSVLSRGRSHEAVLRQALAGGANVIQLRDKQASNRELYRLGLTLQELARQHHAKLIINDRLDVALAVDADGLHVGQDDLPAKTARRLLGPRKILGVSVENGEQARQAELDGADYVAIGPIYEARGSKSDAGAPVGPKAIAEVRHATRLPLVAIGGIKRHHIPEVIAAGADGIAVISAVVSAPDPETAARELADDLARAKATVRAR